MKSAAVLVALSLALVSACTVEQAAQPNPSAQVAAHDFLVPMLCNKQHQCAPELFATKYPNNGELECREKIESAAASTFEGKTSSCSKAELRHCQDVFFAIDCSAADDQGLPPSPPECTKC